MMESACTALCAFSYPYHSITGYLSFFFLPPSPLALVSSLPPPPCHQPSPCDGVQTVQYILPQHHTKLAQAELLIIDEAAAIPLPTVRPVNMDG